MTDPIVPDPVAVAGMNPSLKQAIVTVYRELADGNARLGFHDLAVRCATNAALLDAENVIVWEAEP
jgi:hypothetical protein